MIKINNKFNENLFYFQTEGGMDVLYLKREGFRKSTAVLGIPFGSFDLNQKNNGQDWKHPLGLAHFLEHKIFEDLEGDILSRFTEMGANANAFTSHEETMYYFTTQNNIYEPLELLLKFVRRLDISEESVEKEKGIIIEEIKMYEAMPETRLMRETYKSLLFNHPLIHDIAGSEESVASTTIKDLQEAFDLNYFDSRMVLTLVSNVDENEIKKFINSKTCRRNIDVGKVARVAEKEPLGVRDNNKIVYDTSKSQRVTFAFKFPYQGKYPELDEVILKMILEQNFTALNENYQSYLDREIINGFFAFDISLYDGFGLLIFLAETDKEKEFKRFILDYIADLKLDENKFEQVKKRMFGDSIFSLSSSENTAINITRFHLKSKSYFDFLQDLQKIEYIDLQEKKALIKDTSSSFIIFKSGKLD